MSQGNNNNVDTLFQDAHEQGNLSKDALNLLNNIDLGPNIGDSLGEDISNIPHSEAVLFLGLYDDSSSIRSSNNEQPVRDGHNVILESLRGAKIQDNIQMMALLLNKGTLYPFSFLPQVPQMDHTNYNAGGGTPLYDKTIEICATALAKMQQANDAGISQRVIVCITTDGADWGSNHSAADAAKLVKEIIKTETNYVFGMGIDDGTTDFRDVFQNMGIPSECILTPSNDPKEIRKAFQTMSQSASAAAQGGGFGGFGS